MDNYYYV